MDHPDTCELLCLDAAKASRLRAGLPPREQLERTAEAARGLSDPTRLALALALRDAEDACCVCDLAFVVGRNEKIVSHHVRQLRSAGLAASRKEGRMVLYELTAQGRELLGALIGATETAR